MNGVSALERGTRTTPYPHTVRALADALGLVGAAREELVRLVREAPGAAGAATAPAAPPATAPPAASLAAGPAQVGAPAHESSASAALRVPATALVGRGAELSELIALLAASDVRLVTVTGPGGVGKTRLATEVTQRLTDAGTFADGVVVIGLATVTEASAVAGALAETMGVRPAGRTASDAVTEHLRDRQLLLVVDNLEQVLDVGAELADLIGACPELTVLATSRAPLQVRGEVEYPLPPLPLPETTRSPRPEQVLASAAGRLFVERAQAVVPSFALTPTNAADVAAICWRLGGLPLAIELAAPKVRLLDPAVLLARLDAALAGGWARDLPARQRTMQATLDWSHELLEPEQRRLLAALGVCAGGFDLVTAEAVGAGALPADAVLGALDALVTQSLVTVVRTRGGGTSYGLLEPVRHYALDRLRLEPGAEEAARRRHLTHFLALAERAAPEFQGRDQVQWLRRTDWESANISAATSYALAAGDAEAAARLCWALWLAWWVSGHVREGEQFADQALQGELSPAVRVRAHLVRACMLYAQDEIARAERDWAAALAMAEQAGDDLARAYGECGLGLVAMSTGRFDAAADLLGGGAARAEQLGEAWLWSLCQTWLGTVRLAVGDTAGAIPFFERGLASARQRGDHLVAYSALYSRAQAALADGDPAAAEHFLAEGIALSIEAGDRANLAFCLEALALAAARQQGWARAARLLGAAAGMREAAGATVYQYYLPDEERRRVTEAAARDALGSGLYQEAYEEGRGLDIHGAAALAGSRPGQHLRTR